MEVSATCPGPAQPARASQQAHTEKDPDITPALSRSAPGTLSPEPTRLVRLGSPDFRLLCQVGFYACRLCFLYYV